MTSPRSNHGSLDLRFLGPVRAELDGRAVPLGGPRQRALLALLALEPGRAVPSDRLIDELWAGDPPEGAEVTLRTYVSRLRVALGDAAQVRRSRAGYALEVQPESIDARRFQADVRKADAALEQRRSGVAAAILREALGQWHGTPYADLPVDGALRTEAERLEELRLHALESRMEAELGQGAAAELIDELESLVRQHPYREAFWRQLMLALYRSERQADALGAFHRARIALDEQLGIEPGTELQALEGAILRQEVPAARPTQDRRNLPEPLTSFIGREAELDALAAVLGAARLVTLTGVGGVGKTRLAIQIAQRQASNWPDGIAFVDLSTTTDPALVPRQVASALELREQPDEDLGESLAARLRDSALLVVLDNCEHLAGASAEFAHALLTRCRGVQVLATSRELLGVPGEVDVPVQPLALPVRDASHDELRASDSVRLFLARAGEARRGISDDAATVVRVAEICRDLDGLPLAIELAAARAMTLSLDDIAERVRERFKFLVSWRRLATARHRTLRQAIDWSFDLLTEPEQELLTGLSVFSGGTTLRAVVAVCTDGDEEAALALLERLVASSLINPVHGGGETRYRLLETVRQYAAERLQERGEAQATRRRHAMYYRSMLDAAWAPMRLAETASWTSRLAAEHDNLRAALTWARDAGEHDELLRLAEGMWYFWWIHGDVREGREWLASALELAPSQADPVLLSRALGGAGRLAWAGTDFDAAWELADAARAALPRDAGALDHGILFQTLGVIATARGDLSAARAWLEQARERFESLPANDPWRRDRLAGVLIVLGSVDFFEGSYARATEHYREALADCLARDDRDGVALCELYIGHVALLEGRIDESRALVWSSLRHYHALGWLQFVTECYELIAFGAYLQGRADDAVRLIGIADALRERTGNKATLALARRREEAIPALRGVLGEEAYDSMLVAGRALSDEQALAEAERIVST